MQVNSNTIFNYDLHFFLVITNNEYLTGVQLIIQRETLTTAELKKMAESRFGNMVKAVVDIRRKIMAVDAELHSDEEALLLEDGSCQVDLWGINIYPEFDKNDSDFVEFDSMIKCSTFARQL